MSNLCFDQEAIAKSAREVAEKDRIKAYKKRFHELYENYRIAHPNVTDSDAIAFIRRVMSSSNDIKFEWKI